MTADTVPTAPETEPLAVPLDVQAQQHAAENYAAEIAAGGDAVKLLDGKRVLDDAGDPMFDFPEAWSFVNVSTERRLDGVKVRVRDVVEVNTGEVLGRVSNSDGIFHAAPDDADDDDDEPEDTRATSEQAAASLGQHLAIEVSRDHLNAGWFRNYTLAQALMAAAVADAARDGVLIEASSKIKPGR